MFPVDAHPTVSTPSSSALVIPTLIPRSLKLPVGLDPSTLISNFTPNWSPNLSHLMNGVPPSCKLIILDSSTGMNSLYFHIVDFLQLKMSRETSGLQIISSTDPHSLQV